jgi:cytochrome c peroxidase
MKRNVVFGFAFMAGIVAVVAGIALSRMPVRAESGSPARGEWKALYHRPSGIPFPEEDTYSETKDTLGRMLFFDPILSGAGDRSCASCHNPGLAWGDGLAKAIGEKPLPLRSPTLYNLAWSEILGWDGKFRGLESVAFAPITSPANMNRKEADLIAALSSISGYRAAFASAFPNDPKPDRKNIESALATFERTLVSGHAPFDRWVEGDETAISESAKRGFDLFNGKAACAECHQGWNFTDGSFQDIGTATGDDVGRGRLFPTSVKLRYAFKVPTLRDVARRAPYMHDGSEPTLAAVIDLYDRGGIDRPSRSELIKPLGLTAGEKADLIAFLKTLNEEPKPFVNPILPR